MILLVHGGAGYARPGGKALKKLHESLSSGYEILSKGGTALNSVIESIKVLEDSGIFNAGSGGNLQMDGVRRLDASLMEGRGLRAGSVIGLEDIRNPILVEGHHGFAARDADQYRGKKGGRCGRNSGASPRR